MVSSILTNNGAMTALQSLKSTQKNLLETQNRISTGLKVSTAKDNAATWAVATSMRGDIANYKQVSENLSVSSGIVSTAAAGAEKVASLISDIRTQVTSAQDGVKDAKTVQASIDALLGQINSIVDSSTFKGVNLLNGSKDGDTKVLASVNADGGVQTPAYITVAEQNLTTASDGALSSLKGFSVAGTVDKWAFSQPTDTTATGTSTLPEMSIGDSVNFTFKLNGASKTATFTAAKALDMGNVEDVQTFMKGMRDAINTAAGASNQIASLDDTGRLVVDASLGTDAISFDGANALTKGVDAYDAMTLGKATDLNPPAPKFVYTKPTGTVSGTPTYDFNFKIDGKAVTASYTVPGSGSPTYDTVMKGVADAINAAAGVDNAIASLDVAGNLVVDAALASSKIEFDGASALKTQDGNIAAAPQVAKTTEAFTAVTDFAAAAISGDEMTFEFTVNGATKTARLNLLTGNNGGAFAANATGTDDAVKALVNTINAMGYGNIASSGTAKVLTIDTGASSLGSSVAYNAASALKVVAGAGGTGVIATTAAVAGAGPVNSTTKFSVGVDTTTNKLAAGDTVKFTFTQNSQTKTAQVIVGATQNKAEVLRALANEINSQAGAVIAGVEGDVGAEKIFVDGTRASQPVTYANSGAITGVKHSTVSPTMATDETEAKDSSYEGLLGTLKEVESSVLSAGAAFGAAQTRIDLQKDFMDKLVDTLTSGVGALVDADMSEEAARLQALQVQEQLGTQALSIANQAPQSILRLFQ
jgi:flagellin-like hook-associated protein FlgL